MYIYLYMCIYLGKKEHAMRRLRLIETLLVMLRKYV